MIFILAHNTYVICKNWIVKFKKLLIWYCDQKYYFSLFLDYLGTYPDQFIIIVYFQNKHNFVLNSDLVGFSDYKVLI